MFHVSFKATIIVGLALLTAAPALADGYLDQWHLEQASKALAADKANPTRLVTRGGTLEWQIPGHAQYASHSAMSAYRVLDSNREKVVVGPKAKEARKLLVQSRRRELKATMHIAEQLIGMTPSRTRVRVNRHYAASQDVPRQGLSLVKMFRHIRRDLGHAMRRHATVPLTDALNKQEMGRLRKFHRILGGKLRTHDRASLVGRIGRKWRAHKVRSDRRFRAKLKRAHLL